MTYIPWTEEEESIIRKLHSAGATIEEMADVLRSRNRTAIRLKLDRMGLKPNHPGPEIDYAELKRILGEADEL